MHVPSQTTASHTCRLALLIVAVCCSRATLCQDSVTRTSNRPVFPEYIQEFFLSDAVRCQGKGEVQLTVAVDSRQQLGTSFVTKIEYGVTSRLQFGFELPYGTTEEER